jgi:dienelactone hydrolase
MFAINSPMPVEARREDVEFQSSGTTCRGWLFRPASSAAPTPLVVMAHGFGGTRDLRLPAYAQRFADAGFASLIFDYATFGASDGAPRNDHDWRRQLVDWHAALSFARGLPGVDAGRIALWGTSFAGGLVVSVAAREPDVAAIVCQCPLLDGRAASLEIVRYGGLGSLLRLGAVGVRDVAGAAFGRPPRYVPLVAKPGALGVMTSADAWDGHSRFQVATRPEVTARSALRVSGFRPIRDASRVQCPALLQICTRDTVAPVSAVEAAAKRMPRADVVRYPVGHFDIYFDEAFEQSVRDQTAFLRRHLAN